MKTTTRLFATAALAALALSGCDASPTDSATGSASSDSSDTSASAIPEPSRIPETCTSEKSGEALSVGIVIPNTQALFFNQIVTGAQKIADESDTELEVVSANDDPSKQTAAIENFVSSGKDVVIVSAIDVEAVKPAIEAADAAGVPVVAVDGIVDDGAVSAQVGTSNEEAGGQMGDFLADLAGDSGEVGIVGATNSFVQNQRQQGFEDAVTEKGMTIGTVVDGKNVQEDAQTASENLLTGAPDLEYVYATGEPALIGAVAAVQNSGRADDISVVGWDLSDAAVDGLNDGFVKGVVQQDTFAFGYESMTAAVDLGCGRDVDKEIPVDTHIVTPDTVDDYMYYLAK